MKKFTAFLAATVLAVNSIALPAFAWNSSRTEPNEITDEGFMFPAFSNGDVLLNKRQGRLPAMGWNSWNAFGSANTEATTKAMADSFIHLGLDELGYEYIVLDDGCYKSTRVDGKLSNDTTKFPSGFKALGDYIHAKGFKFGMYNDIGTNLCAGAAVGTVGYEDIDAQTYKEWGVDFLKVDNCYYLWDNATYSGADKAQYSYAPNIRSITVSGNSINTTLNAVTDGVITGDGAVKNTSGNYVTNIGTKDGTNVGTSPVGDMWSELEFNVTAPVEGEYNLVVNYASGAEAGVGRWLQVAVGPVENEVRYYDDFLTATSTKTSFTNSPVIKIQLNEGENVIRLMNHRRQENVLQSYAALLDSLNKYDSEHDTLLSICEWGKTQPQDWGYKVGDSWRILNDISFSVGVNGSGQWSSSNTASITSQYNKAVIMDEFAGLDRGWNDPDMLVIGMNGITETMSKTHMTMWCMMNSPLMLGLDLRKVEKGDAIWNIIANGDMIALNQDALGIQAKRIYSSAVSVNPDTTYIENNNRVDILAKPLSNGDVAISFINLKTSKDAATYSVKAEDIYSYIGTKMVDAERFENAEGFIVKDLWTKEVSVNTDGVFSVSALEGCDNVTIRVTPLGDTDGAKEFLKEKTIEARELIEGRDDYPINSANEALKNVISKAEAMCESNTVIVAEIGEMTIALSEAVSDWEDAYKTKDALKEQIEYAKKELEEATGGSEADFVEEISATYKTEIEKAEGIYQSIDATVSDFEEAKNILIEAGASFNETFKNCYALKDEIADVESMLDKPEVYVADENWEKLSAEYENALSVYASAADENDVIVAFNALRSAKIDVNYNQEAAFEPDIWYVFDNASSLAVRDVSGNGNDATLKNSGAKVMSGNKLSLNMSDENNGYLQLPSGTLSGAEEFTFTAWVNQAEARAWARLFDIGMSSSNGYMFVVPYTNSGQLRYAITDTGSSGEEQLNTSAVGEDEWVHISVVQEKSEVAVYINGIKMGAATITKTPESSIKTAQNSYIGKSQYNDPYFKGEIKDVRIYTKPLTEEQIASIVAMENVTIAEIESSYVTTAMGSAPELPKTVTVKTEDGKRFALPVTWLPYDEANITKGKSFTIYGDVAQSDIKAELLVNMTSESLVDDCAIMINEGEEFSFVVTNLSDADKKFRLVVAEFDKEGNLASSKLKDVVLSPDENVTEAFSLEGMDTDNLIKAFVWDENQRPLTRVKIPGNYEYPLWTIRNAVSENTYTNDDESVTIITEEGDLWGRSDNTGTVKNMYLTAVPEESRDNFTVTVKATFKPNENYQRAALVVYAGDGNVVSVMRRYHSSYGGNVFMTTMNTNGSAGSETRYTKDTFEEECLLRITKSGSSFYGYFSTDNGVTWNELETRVQQNIDSAGTIYTGFYASNGDQSADNVPVVFESFTFNDKIYKFSNIN